MNQKAGFETFLKKVPTFDVGNSQNNQHDNDQYDN